MAQTPLERAYKQFDQNQSRLADALGTSQQNVSNWLRKRKPLPAEYVLAAEKATGIARHDWRPDIYPTPAFSPVQQDAEQAA